MTKIKSTTMYLCWSQKEKYKEKLLNLGNQYLSQWNDIWHLPYISYHGSGGSGELILISETDEEMFSLLLLRCSLVTLSSNSWDASLYLQDLSSASRIFLILFLEWYSPSIPASLHFSFSSIVFSCFTRCTCFCIFDFWVALLSSTADAGISAGMAGGSLVCMLDTLQIYTLQDQTLQDYTLGAKIYEFYQ